MKEKELTITEINSLLKNIAGIAYNKAFEKVASDSTNKFQYADDGIQGEYDVITTVYRHKDLDVYLKTEQRTDSYGRNENEQIYSIQIVKPVLTQVTQYQEI